MKVLFSNSVRQKLLLMFLFLTTHQILSAQQKPEPSQSVTRDYALNMYREFRWGSEALKAMVFLSLRSQGYDNSQILLGMEKLDVNKSFRKATYRAWYRYTNGSYDFMMQNLVSIGMSAGNANTLSSYIIGFHEQEYKEEEKKQLLEEKKIQIENQKKEAARKLEEQRKEVLRKIEEKKKAEEFEKKKNVLQNKIYDLASHLNDYNAWLSIIEMKIANQLMSLGKSVAINDKVDVYYEDKVAFKGDPKIKCVLGTDSTNLIDVSDFRPILYVEDVRVPLKFTSNIELNFQRDVIEVHLKKGNNKIKYLKQKPPKEIEAYLNDVITVTKTGKYMLTYNYGNVGAYKIREHSLVSM